MSIAAAFICFVVCLIASFIFNVSMIIPISLGLVFFTLSAMHKGFSFRDVMTMAAPTVKDSFIVIKIMVLIGCLTGLWRVSGTVAVFVYYGISIIPRQLFVLAAFLLSGAMSFALGTSFGVAATCGVILMAIAGAGGVNPVIAAGAVMSGIYIGDRGSPAASSGNLTAVVTGTDMRDNVRLMFKTALVPFAICVIIYSVLSYYNPMEISSPELLGSIGNQFSLSLWCFLPAVIMIVLPFCRVKITISMLLSIASSFLITIFIQGESAVVALSTMVMGYECENPALAEVFSGGGIVSMLEVCAILAISGAYGGIFRGAGLLSATDELLKRLAAKVGRFETMLIMSVPVCALFCNQTIGIIMQSELSRGLYGDSSEEKTAHMIHLENSVVTVAGLVPWCIASSVPLGMLGVGAGALLYSCYLYLVPLIYLLWPKRHRIA